MIMNLLLFHIQNKQIIPTLEKYSSMLAEVLLEKHNAFDGAGPKFSALSA